MPIVVKWLNVPPCERAALRLGFTGATVAGSYADVASLVRPARDVRWTVADSKNVEGQFHEPH